MNVNAALERGNLIGDLFVCFVSAIWHVKVPMTHCFAAPLVLLNAAHLATLTDIRDGDEDAFSTEAFTAPVAAVAERPAVPAGTFIKSLQAISTSIESVALKSLFGTNCDLVDPDGHLTSWASALKDGICRRMSPNTI